MSSTTETALWVLFTLSFVSAVCFGYMWWVEVNSPAAIKTITETKFIEVPKTTIVKEECGVDYVQEVIKQLKEAEKAKKELEEYIK